MTVSGLTGLMVCFFCSLPIPCFCDFTGFDVFATFALLGQIFHRCC